MCSLRWEQPTIASRLAYSGSSPEAVLSADDGQLIYEVARNESDIDAWLTDVVMDRHDALEAVGGDVEKAVALVRHELGCVIETYNPSQLEVHYIPNTRGESALVLRCGHALFDGIGTFEVLNALISKLALVISGEGSKNEIVWGTETERLVGPAVEYTRVPWSEAMVKKEYLVVKKMIDGIMQQRGHVSIEPDAYIS